MHHSSLLHVKLYGERTSRLPSFTQHLDAEHTLYQFKATKVASLAALDLNCEVFVSLKLPTLRPKICVSAPFWVICFPFKYLPATHGQFEQFSRMGWKTASDNLQLPHLITAHIYLASSPPPSPSSQCNINGCIMLLFSARGHADGYSIWCMFWILDWWLCIFLLRGIHVQHPPHLSSDSLLISKYMYLFQLIVHHIFKVLQ